MSKFTPFLSWGFFRFAMGPNPRLRFFSTIDQMENCTFSFVVLVYLLVTMLACKPSKKMLDLTPIQQEIYDTIKQERLMLFSIGMLCGALVSTYFVTVLKLPYPKCTIFALTYLFAVLFYTVVPKSTYMVYHLNGDQQKEWMHVYNKMKITNALFFTLAVVSLIIRVWPKIPWYQTT